MLGWSRRRTLRVLYAAHVRSGGTLLSSESEGHGARYTVTKAALRRAFPDWFVSTENLEARVDALEDASKEHGKRLLLVATQTGANTRAIAGLKAKAA